MRLPAAPVWGDVFCCENSPNFIIFGHRSWVCKGLKYDNLLLHLWGFADNLHHVLRPRNGLVYCLICRIITMFTSRSSRHCHAVWCGRLGIGYTDLIMYYTILWIQRIRTCQTKNYAMERKMSEGIDRKGAKVNGGSRSDYSSRANSSTKPTLPEPEIDLRKMLYDRQIRMSRSKW